MRRALRRWFRCRKGQHRETLDVTRVVVSGWDGTEVAAHEVWWRCVDCGKRKWIGGADAIEATPKVRRIA